MRPTNPSTFATVFYLIVITWLTTTNDICSSHMGPCCCLIRPAVAQFLNGSDAMAQTAACSVQSWSVAVSDVIQYIGWQTVLLLVDDTVCERERGRLGTLLSDRLVGTTAIFGSQEPPSPAVIQQGLNLANLSGVKNALICLRPSTLVSVLQQMTVGRYQFSNTRWLVACPEPQQFSQREVNSLGIQLAFVTPASSSSPTSATTLTPVATPSPPGQDELHIVGYYGTSGLLSVRAKWTPVAGLVVYTDTIFDSGLSLFGDTPLRIGVTEAVPFLKRLSPVNGRPNYEGMCMDMLEEIAARLKFRYELVEPPDGYFGSPEANGSWNGMVGMLVRRELDLAIGPISITSMREEVIDFTVPFMQDGGGILTKGGEPSPDILTVFNPLPVAMWLSLGGAVLVTGVVLYVSTLVVGGMESSYIEGEQSHGHAPWSIWESVFIVFGALVGQDTGRHPVSLSGRVVLGVWWFFTILIMSIYLASLAALMTVRKQGQTVDSIQDLADSSLQPVTIKGTNWYTAFTVEAADVFLKVGQRLKAMDAEQQAVDMVKEGGAAYIADVSAVDFIYRQDCRNLYMAEQVFSLNGLGFAVPQGVEYKNAISNVMLKLQESGVLNVWRRHWWQATSGCSDQSTSLPMGINSVTDNQLEVVSIGALLGLYGAVVLLSSFLFLLRLLWRHCCRHFCRRRTPAVSREQQ